MLHALPVHRVVVLYVFLACSSFLRSAEPEAISASSSVSFAGYEQIGGIPQWITIRGDHRDNPVVLFIHGGPGNPMSLYADALYAEWEKEFTLAQWDQRGSGKTYEANLPSTEMTVEEMAAHPLSLDQMVQDGIAVAEHLCKRLGKPKVMLTGTSWGSALAVLMVEKRPDLFSCYVGLSQLVNYEASLSMGYQRVLVLAKAHNDVATLNKLASLGSPPWRAPRNFGLLRRLERAYEQFSVDLPLPLSTGEAYKSKNYEAAYTAGEDYSYVQFVGLNGDGLGHRIALDRDQTVLRVPVYLLQGTEDLLTLPSITKRYFDALTAPAKSFLEIPRCGHDPNIAMLHAQRETLRRAVSK